MYRTPVQSGTASIERISAMDLTVLATDRGPVPMNIGAVLEFNQHDGPSLAEVRTLLAERLPAIPSLRQRLHRPPPGMRPPGVDRRHRLRPGSTSDRRANGLHLGVVANFSTSPPTSSATSRPWLAAVARLPGVGLGSTVGLR